MAFDLDRLLAEKRQVSGIFPGTRPFRFAGSALNSWSSYGCEFHHERFRVLVTYDDDHPLRQPRVEIIPPPTNRHYYHDHLCYLFPGEWSPRYTMATVVGIVQRFLTLYVQGAVE